ncbi:hypothetical protein K466DRAFT_403754 [Polyporus arcularius HHB13444]|uniref:F-box domain-containing protein n=1 Tax=Polyporus arcularius HHB13444 TaxID=1314778 RepID=A0A5C3PJY8_9APHY|nr:hypothetical protein K466DRAFT_403754 [Polyporus arcularius HHB13444]
MPTDSQLPFPAELTEAIIDFVDDEQTLRATSLVCKAWVARSRYNLFRVVELCLPAHLDRFNGLLASSPHIAPHIKEIAVSENSLLALLRPAMAIVARLPNSLLKHPQVKPHRLAVHNQSWLPTRYHPEYLTGLSQLSTISSLDLFDVTFTTVADFSIILRALRRLRSLSATHLDAQRQLPSEELVAIGAELPLLTSLRVISQYPTSVIDWLLQYNTFPVLQDAEVSYEISGIDPNQGLGPFWHATGSTLENLSLTISKRASGASFPIQVIEKLFDMSRCTALRALRVDFRQERELAPDWAWLVWLLSHLPKHGALRSLAFAFQHSSHALATLHQFAAEVDRVLADAPSFSLLNQVVFEFDYRNPAEVDQDEDALLAKFPALSERGILHVELSA